MDGRFFFNKSGITKTPFMKSFGKKGDNGAKYGIPNDCSLEIYRVMENTPKKKPNKPIKEESNKTHKRIILTDAANE